MVLNKANLGQICLGLIIEKMGKTCRKLGLVKSISRLLVVRAVIFVYLFFYTLISINMGTLIFINVSKVKTEGARISER